MRIVELIIESETDGIDAVSVVDLPAIESNFIALATDFEIKLAEVDSEKRILMGAALIPNKQIFRRVDDDEFYVFFSKETVKKASELFLKNGNQSNATLQHDGKIDGMTVVESWIVDDLEYDKSKKYGFSVPIGTWMISMKVDNEDVWGRVKSGEIKGFSIEGYFADKLEMQKEQELIDQIIKILENE